MRLVLAAACAAALAHGAPPARPQPARSGAEFAGADVRALQADEFANPGMLWVAGGERLWRAAAGRSGKACSDCHGDATTTMKGVAARYPRLDPATKRPMDLEARVNDCREKRQLAPALAPESAELLALSAYVTHQSKGMPLRFSADPALRPYLDRGRALYHRRIGQMNLACTHCHDRNWGRRLLNETISQGHPNGFPAYRLGWESVGSIARRIRACFYGVRAEMPDYGAPELLELEVYLAWRAQGLPVESPAVRR